MITGQLVVLWNFRSLSVNADSHCFILYFTSTGVHMILSWQIFLYFTGTKLYYTFIVKAGEVECYSYLFIAFEYVVFMTPEWVEGFDSLYTNVFSQFVEPRYIIILLKYFTYHQNLYYPAQKFLMKESLTKVSILIFLLFSFPCGKLIVNAKMLSFWNKPKWY